MKIVDYKVVREVKRVSRDELEKRIKALLEEGWQPFYGPFTDKQGHECQPMVRYEEEKTKSGKKSQGAKNED